MSDPDPRQDAGLQAFLRLRLLLEHLYGGDAQIEAHELGGLTLGLFIAQHHPELITPMLAIAGLAHAQRSASRPSGHPFRDYAREARFLAEGGELDL